jgi:hypothetical protein
MDIRTLRKCFSAEKARESFCHWEGACSGDVLLEKRKAGIKTPPPKGAFAFLKNPSIAFRDASLHSVYRSAT